MNIEEKHFDSPTDPNSPLSSADADVCTVIQECATQASYDAPFGYYSFDLHYLIAEDEWACVQYSNGQSDASSFNVADADVGDVFGFSA